MPEFKSPDDPPEEKILHFSDLHADPTHLAAVLEICRHEKPVIVAISGDLTNWENDRAKDLKTLEESRRFLIELDRHWPVAFCSGNHEEWTAMHAANKWEVACPNNQSTVFNRGNKTWIISCFPYGDNGTSTDALHQEHWLQQKYPEAIRIWLHHEPPLGSSCGWSVESFNGCPRIREVIRTKKPDLLLCGHVHSAPFTGGLSTERMFETICCNPGSCSNRADMWFYKTKPNYIRITGKRTETITP